MTLPHEPVAMRYESWGEGANWYLAPHPRRDFFKRHCRVAFLVPDDPLHLRLANGQLVIVRGKD